MRRACSGLLAALVVVVGLAGCSGRRPSAEPAAPAASTCPPVAERAWGVHQDLGYEPAADRRAKAMDLAASALHARISRSSLLWDQVEPAAGRRDWSRYD
ncbi:MAG: hypothetical protein QOI20_133, partial [Acidimicrobiaceae bacterium]|nr:hypothetical protein [Acidimicrobiaceae bacterium]